MKELLVHASLDQQVLAKTLTPYTGRSGLYSSVCPTEESRELLLSICAQLQIPTTEEEEFHSTIMYAPDVVLDQALVLRNVSHSTCEAIPVGFELFGPEKDTLVMTLMSPSMAKMHNKWKALGCIPTYPHYQPHVTILKPSSLTEDDLPRLTSWLLNHDGDKLLRFYPEEVEDIS